MSFDLKRMYDLLPAIDRIRDAEQGEPLKALLTVIAEQTAVLEEDLAQSYDDHFIETCADWVVPYIGDLIGYRGLHGVVPRISNPRGEVAGTIGYRRRKGTVAALEQLARDVTGWHARGRVLSAAGNDSIHESYSARESLALSWRPDSEHCYGQSQPD